jgi:hypothetical protein
MILKVMIIKILLFISFVFWKVIRFPGRLLFAMQLFFGIWCLRSLDRFMIKKHYPRIRRRCIWRDMIKSAENRSTVYDVLKTWKI